MEFEETSQEKDPEKLPTVLLSEDGEGDLKKIK